MRTTTSTCTLHSGATRQRFALLALLAVGFAFLGAGCSSAPGAALFTSPQANPIVLSEDGSRLYVANTTTGTVDVIDTASLTILASIEVGIDPVGLAVRPGDTELWVSNHISDSVSVINTAPGSETLHQVIQTVQDFDADGVTLFDEPVGIAFAEDGSKAYVAISSTNDIAVVNTSTYAVTHRLHITAQDPRAIAVRDGRLYVAVFESNNQSELSLCPEHPLDPPDCSLDVDDLVQFVNVSPNIPGQPANIVLDTAAPDRDLYVYSTEDESMVDMVSGVGTLLYGIAVDSDGDVFISQVHARNEVNGLFGEGLIDLENRMFNNQIAHVDCTGASCGSANIFELDPELPAQPSVADSLANPYGIAISDDDATLVVTAAMTSRLFTMDATSGSVIDILDLNDGVVADFGQQIPRGVALRSNGEGAPETAYVLNTLENTVSVVSIAPDLSLSHDAKIVVGDDPTPDDVRRGRIAFTTAFASSSNSFSCESCHPDGNTDQLLWRIGGACFFGACTGDDEIRSTMPIRGLKNTLPLHWDGTLGDPFGGRNGATGLSGNEDPNCTDEHSCFLQLVGESLQGVMCDQAGGCDDGPSGEPGLLTEQERNDMAVFLANVWYPPARSRRMDDSVSSTALDGFSQFFVDQPGTLFPQDVGDFVGVTTCADMDSGCHALPLGADTNSITLAGFDAPTMRGMTDRFLQFSIGITNVVEQLEFAKYGGIIDLGGLFEFNFPPSIIPYDPDEGFEEDVTLAAAFPLFGPVYNSDAISMFQLFEEASTGFSGALGRQVTLNETTTTPGSALNATNQLLDALETADIRGVVSLRGVGVRDTNGGLNPAEIQFASNLGEYYNSSGYFTRAELIAEAQSGDLVLTLTGDLGRNFGDANHPQPLLSVLNLGDGPTGNPDLPLLPGDNPMELVGIDVREDATIFVDGERVDGSISCVGGSFTPFCSSEHVEITLPGGFTLGLRLLQVMNPDGPMSTELPFCVGSVGNCR